MDFKNWNMEKIKKETRSLNAEIKGLENRARELEEEKKSKEHLLEIIKGLKTSWRERYPGKYGAHYTFLIMRPNEYSWNKGEMVQKPAAVKEFLNPEDLENREEIAKKESGIGFYGHYYSRVPLGIPVVSLKEVSHENCPKCKKKVPLIRYYEQTEDSPDGDTWERVSFVICCGEARIIEKKVSDSRM